MRHFIAFALVVATALAAALSAGAGGATAQSPTKSWTGTWNGNLTIIGTCESGALLIVESATGQMQHTGKTAWSDTYCMDPLTWTASGTAGVYTAANGDEIHVQMSLQVMWTSPDGGTWSDTETIISGTGRFATASGSNHTEGTFTFTSPTTEFWDGTTTGTLSY